MDGVSVLCAVCCRGPWGRGAGAGDGCVVAAFCPTSVADDRGGLEETDGCEDVARWMDGLWGNIIRDLAIYPVQSNRAPKTQALPTKARG
jgi:hypothetical protein